MKKILGNGFLKAVAFFLAAILLSLAVVSAFFGILGFSDGSITDENFFETPFCHTYVENNLNDLQNIVYWDGTGALSDTQIGDGTFSYIVFDLNGKIVQNNKAPDSVCVVKGYPIDEVDSGGKVQHSYRVDGYVTKEITEDSELYFWYLAYQNRVQLIYDAIALGGVSLLLILYVLCGAGIGPNGEVRVGGLHKIPYDIILAVDALGVAFGMTIIIEEPIRAFYNFYTSVLWMILCLADLVVLTVLVLSFLETMAARMKEKGWWKNALILHFFRFCVRMVRWFFKSLPLSWKTVLSFCTFTFINVLTAGYAMGTNEEWLIIFLFLFDAAVLALVIWVSVQLAVLKKAGADMATGQFEKGVDTTKLWGEFREHGRNLNCTSVGLSKAVEERMKSERFKTELITNVSHDLKTPLTSIVSYVDLLKKEEIGNEKAKEYIAVLDRQSQKLKKLTEDLVEASKASSGAIPVNRERLDLVELVEQSVGEFSEKLANAEITPVISAPKELFIDTDGRLLWRVLDNLIQNVVKYAQPGTRVYFDIEKSAGMVALSVKNVSRDPLNMSAEALMERFVRGDSSRQSDGNGLGLSIARSLTELCGGEFKLVLDGDLYKVVLRLPLAKPAEESSEN